MISLKIHTYGNGYRKEWVIYKYIYTNEMYINVNNKIHGGCKDSRYMIK